MIRFGVPRAFRLALRRRDRWERDVEDEIKLHLSLRAEQLAAQGVSADEAYREAVRRFGPLDQSRARLVAAATHREHCMRRTEFFSDLRQDLVFALRTLGRQKASTTVTIATLALGIGANTAVFSVVSTLLIHAVPYPNADRVMIVQEQPSSARITSVQPASITMPPRVTLAWRANAHSFEALEPFAFGYPMLSTRGDPVGMVTTHVYPTFLSLAGSRPLLGRMFTDAEVAERAPVALLSASVWQSQFGGNRDVIGRTITLSDTIYTVIGVLPSELRVPTRGHTSTDVWLPIDTTNSHMGLNAFGRLRPGATVAAAQRELDTISAHTNMFPGGDLPYVARLVKPADLVSFHDSLLLLTGAVALVLLVACANVAHLMLARAATRTRELAVRAALGAGRWRLLRQLLVESLLLTFSGAAGGLLVGWLGLKAMVALRPSKLTELGAARLDTTTLIVTISVAVLCGVTFGVIGALQSARQSTHEALKAGSTAASHARRSDRIRSLLVVTEMALSTTLIVGAALLVRSVSNLQHTDLGFAPRSLYSVDIRLPSKRYTTPAARWAFAGQLRSRIAAIPGVSNTALSSVSPGGRSTRIGVLQIQGEPNPAADAGTSFIDLDGIDNQYFATMGIPLLEGTTFTDTSAAANQVIVNAGFARQHWPRGAAVGHRIRVEFHNEGDWQTIVGVVGDASIDGASISADPSAPMMYEPIGSDISGGAIMVRANGVDVAATVRQAAQSIDPQLTPPTVRSMETFVAAAVAGPRFTMVLLSVFTTLSLLLAAVGLYGLMAYAVIQRTREIGIRVALGAQRTSIARLIVLRGVALAFAGAALGLGGAYWATRLLSKLLYGVTPLDLPSFATGAAALVLVAVVACVMPTRRALAVDPLLAMRAE